MSNVKQLHGKSPEETLTEVLAEEGIQAVVVTYIDHSGHVCERYSTMTNEQKAFIHCMSRQYFIENYLGTPTDTTHH